jgi:hypothetical protein
VAGVSLHGIALRDILIAFVAIASSSTLVFSVSEKSKKHSDLASQYGMLEADILGNSEISFTEENVKDWRMKLGKLEAIEPATNRKIVAKCEAELNGFYQTP